jgi:hypothetical protein
MLAKNNRRLIKNEINSPCSDALVDYLTRAKLLLLQKNITVDVLIKARSYRLK